MPWAIQFDNVTKRYRGGGPRYASLRHDVVQLGRSIIGSLRGRSSQPRGRLALDGVSFEVDEGEAFAIIGANGAGKTTALKLLTRISYPTEGRIRVRGRMGALIEVGSGIHPELTGRENIWLYGRIMGMSRADIAQRFDEIVSFAETEQALDTPVKMYSTGMQLRLGFAIASHIDPDIFAVDEALAVGDASFQAKCVERMTRLVREGRTLIFISHNLSAVESVCRRGVLLQAGKVVTSGPVREVLSTYIRSYMGRQLTSQRPSTGRQASGSGEIFLEDVTILDEGGQPTEAVYVGGRLRVRIRYRAERDIDGPIFGIKILANNGVEVSRPSTRDYGTSPIIGKGPGDIEYVMEPVFLNPGPYTMSAFVWDPKGLVPFDEIDSCCGFVVLPGAPTGFSVETFGLVQLPARWVHPVEDGPSSGLEL